jgi:NADH-quinone oxidoreductase subunit N
MLVFHIETINFLFDIKELLLLSTFIALNIFNITYLTINGRVNTNSGILYTCSSIFAIVIFFVLFLFDKNTGIENVINNKYLHITNESVVFVITLLIFAMLYLLILYSSYIQELIKTTADLPVILLMALFGSIIIFYTSNMIIWVLAIEIQSFCLYALAGFRNSVVVLRTKAGIQYFLYGALASLCILLGISFYYFYNGTINLETIVMENETVSEYYVDIFCLSLITLGLSIKLGMPPMYKWLPSVYSTTHVIMVLFFVLIPKIPLLYIITILSKMMFLSSIEDFIIGGGFLVGVISVLRSEDLGSFIAYTTIVGNCFFFTLLTAPEHFQINTFLMYLIWYQVGITVLFLIILFNRKIEGTALINNISDLSLFKSKSNVNAELVILLLIWAAQPPFISFYPKFLLYLNTSLTNNVFSLVMIFIFSIVASFYLIRLISYVIIFNKENTESPGAKISDYFINYIQNKEWIEYISISSYKMTKGNNIISSNTTIISKILTIFLCHFSICGPLLLFLILPFIFNFLLYNPAWVFAPLPIKPSNDSPKDRKAKMAEMVKEIESLRNKINDLRQDFEYNADVHNSTTVSIAEEIEHITSIIHTKVEYLRNFMNHNAHIHHNNSCIIHANLSTLESKVDKLDHRVSVLETKVETLVSELKEALNRISALAEALKSDSAAIPVDQDHTVKKDRKKKK